MKWKIDGEYVVPDPMGPTDCAICQMIIGSDREINARIIAAAPDLLEACKQAKKYLEPDLVEPGRTVFWNLVSAIAKAEAV
jgi:hypothetical protein